MTRVRWALAGATLLVAALAGPAAAAVSFVPLPAIGTSPNEGNTYGVLPVWLFLDQERAIRRIFAPSITFNRIFGVNATLRYFLYPETGALVELIAAASTRGSRNVRLLYEDLRVGPEGRYYLAGEARLNYDPAARFFGIGPDTSDEDETNFTSRDRSLFVSGGLNFDRHWRLAFTERVRKYSVRPGGVESLPFIAERFPDVPGIEGAFVHAQRLDLTFDTRDAPSLTTKGGFLGFGAEVAARALGSDAGFRRGIVDARLFVPTPRLSPRFITVLRAAFEWVDGTAVPFFEQATLGGEDTLRGFGRNRFTDANSVVLNVEERVRLFALELFGTRSEWEVAPFVEVGKVYDRARDLDFGDLAWSAGLGFRGLVRPTVVGRIDIGVGPDGIATFVGLGLPF